MRTLDIVFAVIFAIVITGCESDKTPTPPPELGSVKVSAVGLDGFLGVTLNGEETIHESTQASNVPFSFESTTMVFEKLLETGEAVDIKIERQPDLSYCELKAGQDWVFDAEDNSWFTVFCQPYRKGSDMTSSVDISDTHACAIVDGRAVCFSENPRIFRTPSDLNSPQLLKAGYGFSCAVQADQLICWGDDEYGFASFATPDTVGGIKELELGVTGGCLIDDEDLKCWGDDALTLVTDYPKGLSSPSKLVVKGHSACVLDSGKPYCWGGSVEQGDLPPDLAVVADIDISALYGCAVTDSSSVVCWPNGRSDEPAQVPGDLGRVSSVAVGLNTACAVTDNGLRCWGESGTSLSLTDRIVSYPTELVLAEFSGCAIQESELTCYGPFVAGEWEYWLLRGG